MSVSVKYSRSFLSLMTTLSTSELKLIGDFIIMLSSTGYASLPGRNKPSTGVSKFHVKRLTLIQFAIDNNLWHYHIGHSNYDQTKPFGDWTSSHVVHYQNEPGNIARFVHYASHPPMKLPPQSSLI